MNQLTAPDYCAPSPKIALAVSSMAHHMTDEGWQIMLGLQEAGYRLHGLGLGLGTNIKKVIESTNPVTCVVQDKREWEGLTGDTAHDVRERFVDIEYLKSRNDIFKATILKDAHQKNEYHRQAAEEMGCHAWITYYNLDRVAALAPFVRRNHLVRTYHTVNRAIVPTFTPERKKCIVSGAISKAYPLRKRICDTITKHQLKGVDWLKHPGYSNRTCHTPHYLETLVQYKVSICTASIYQYALRKIIESAACGCLVITNLQENLPVLNNLVRIADDISTGELQMLIDFLADTWDANTQQKLAEQVQEFYNYQTMGRKLAIDLEKARLNYVAKW